ncbi:hypothetical protein CW304_11470 [Bacillus sp. UFRGS-B20]|nr:hypothetical protein CW304_11470 [Bacillus sp. UFRGS-B20]
MTQNELTPIRLKVSLFNLAAGNEVPLSGTFPFLTLQHHSTPFLSSAALAVFTHILRYFKKTESLAPCSPPYTIPFFQHRFIS